ncbi:MFS transporter [Streptomyces sp. NPDC056983]|uniref:MFS transporter n=1 Tax=Streptomyces sp. NPDC056983 TaxID=3345987 RepID=UPI00363135E8
MTQPLHSPAVEMVLAGTSGEPPEISPRRMRRVGLASTTGSVIEFYDFNIYGTSAALVFPHLFFPALGTAAGAVASFATLGVAFLARPLGSVLFGHFGDRLGRKKTLLATMILMAISTTIIGVLPTAGQIGVLAPIILVLLRVLQGFAAGGEWAGAALFAVEYAPKDKRGFWGMAPALGGGFAVVLANLTFFATGLGMSEDAFLSWGWRIPFLAGLILLPVGLYIRLRIDETPVFKQQISTGGTPAAPVKEAFTRQSRQIFLAAGVGVGSLSLLYLGLTYMAGYGKSELNLSSSAVLLVNVAAGVGLCIGSVIGAMWSDRIGRRAVLIRASASGVVWSLVLFPLADLGSVLPFTVGIVMATFIAGIGFGPLGALVSELFGTRYRYTAAGLCYNGAGIIGGAIPPIIATPIVTGLGGPAFGVVLACFCLLSLLSCLALKETQENELDGVSAS